MAWDFKRSTAATRPVCGGIQVAADLLVVAVDAGIHPSLGIGTGSGTGADTLADRSDVRCGHVAATDTTVDGMRRLNMFSFLEKEKESP